jgi:hypothetical protein
MGQWFDKLTILSKVEGMRVLGLEPRTYGLKGRCSTSLSYTPKVF